MPKDVGPDEAIGWTPAADETSGCVIAAPATGAGEAYPKVFGRKWRFEDAALIVER